jgi:hypothetical protein
MKYTGYMLQHFLKSINKPRTKHKICREGDNYRKVFTGNEKVSDLNPSIH